MLERSYRGSRGQKGATSPATSTTKANAATVPHMNGSAVGAEPINTATPTTKAIPARMKTSHVTSLRVHASEFAPDPTDLSASGNAYICLAAGRRKPNSPRGEP
jgi:hypothetical protein